jgi:hypothetical protein
MLRMDSIDVSMLKHLSSSKFFKKIRLIIQKRHIDFLAEGC